MDEGFKKGGKFGAQPKGRSPGSAEPKSNWKPEPDPTFDKTSTRAAMPTTMAKDYAPQPERAQRRSFGVGEGDQ